MDDVARLISAFGARDSSAGTAWKLDILMDLGRFDGPRVVAFYAAVVADPEEPPEVRAEALRRLREASLTPEERVRAADASVRALAAGSDVALRLLGALALDDFIDVEGALPALGRVAANPDEPIDLRYNAFTSLQRTGPTPACVEILRALASDETLGQSATRLLAVWESR
jgi:hypothetical protein